MKEISLKQMAAHCVRDFPLEACGLLVGDAGADRVSSVTPTGNADGSARTYTVAPLDLMKADRAAATQGLDVIGVYHSHTHTDAYPSPTDVAAAPDPSWHYVLVSLRDTEPSVRSYRIEDGKILEEDVVVEC